MGRKSLEVAVILLTVVFFSLIFAGLSVAHGAEIGNLRVFVRMQPEAPNSVDGRFWEGSDVRVKLELQEKDEKGNWGVKGIEGSWKIYYSWDVLENGVQIEFREPFPPIDGEHWLFAYAVNEKEKMVTAVTKFFVQYRRLPPVPLTQHIYVSGEYVKYGESGYESPAKTGQITAEATSTTRIISPTPTASNAAAALNFIQHLVSGRTNLWIVLLVIGLALLVAVKVIFREKK